MTSLPVLALPDFSLPFYVTTDASTVAIGAVLSQRQHPISFFSKKMGPRMMSSSRYVRGLFVITETVQTLKQQKRLSKLIGYNFEILYKPRKDNVVVDALSRLRLPTDATFAGVSSPIPIFLSELRQFCLSHPAGQKLLSIVRGPSTSANSLRERSGLLYMGDRLFVPPQSGLTQQLIAEFH
ncbi:Retrovirus-related Pol polyprotein from transposon [Sesamum angolense]|uniref:Retrovirus-related Pol polyprotein from transposon n=1 Tax=Sesamum angolense TaxID=2727404 RepID=A0AAE1WAR4_9LAMI|nr:Retrovirus-related Pol polyprotein from transposon [Sesamum angolense]